jgi:hypothetical protein
MMRKLEVRFATTALIVSGALLLLPGVAPAAQFFGVNLSLEGLQPNQPSCELLGPCTIVGFTERPAEGQLATAGAPIDGVITRFAIKPKVEDAPVQVTFRVANLTPVNDGEGGKSAKATATGTGPTVTLPVTPEETEPVLEFPARLAVKKGQRLGLDWPGQGAGLGKLTVTSDSNGDRNGYEFAPPLANGSGERASNEFLGFLLVQATVEPDADHDGFGDETQDRCPAQKASQGACDRTKPAITGLKVKRGKISYRLSEPARVRIAITKRSGRHFKGVRKFAGPGKKGANRVRLPRAGSLVSGAYRITVTATDPAGNRSVRKAGFRITG